MNKIIKPSTTILLPMRAGSQRVINKNLRPFAGYRYGLAELKIRQLLETHNADEILVDTDIESVDEIVSCLLSNGCDISRIRVERRDPYFARSETSTDELITYLAAKVQNDLVVWTHSTQPFITAAIIDDAVNVFIKNSQFYDSLMSVTAVRDFLWDDKGPLNYDRNVEKWPRTQTLPVWYMINSGIFINSASDMMARKDRIGDKPFFYEMDKQTGWDIDDIDDFEIAEFMAMSGKVNLLKGPIR